VSQILDDTTSNKRKNITFAHMEIFHGVPTSAGLALIYENKILIGHPTNAPWKGTYSIPKGLVDKGETFIDAAIRETSEEVGITIDKSKIEIEPRNVLYKWGKKGEIKKQVIYFYVHLDELPQECHSNGIVYSRHLQVEEIDWAGFVDKSTAQNLLFWRQMPILERLK